jgi:hypothetical protein
LIPLIPLIPLVSLVSLVPLVPLISLALIEEFRKDTRAFLPDSVQRPRVETDGAQDCGSDLLGVHQIVDLARFEEFGRDEQGHMSVVQRPATVLSNLLLAARVDHAVIGLNEYVRRSGRGN